MPSGKDRRVKESSGDFMMCHTHWMAGPTRSSTHIFSHVSYCFLFGSCFSCIIVAQLEDGRRQLQPTQSLRRSHIWLLPPLSLLPPVLALHTPMPPELVWTPHIIRYIGKGTFIFKLIPLCKNQQSCRC